MSTDRPLVFIVSGGRTGTAFFGERLSSVIDGAFSVHEPDLFTGFNRESWGRIATFGWWHVVFGKLLGRTGLRAIGTRYLQGSLSPRACRQRIADSRDCLHTLVDARLIIESTAQWWYLVDQIQAVWPQARIIAIIRDPRTWVRSWINRGGRYDARDRVAWTPPGRLTPAKLGERDWAKRWPSLDTFGRLAWEWKTVYSRLDAVVESSANSRMFRFEDLFSPDGSALNELVEFAANHDGEVFPVGDLSGFTVDVRNASAGPAPEWPEWSAARASLMNELCGPLMRRYGYGTEPEWSALIGAEAEASSS